MYNNECSYFRLLVKTFSFKIMANFSYFNIKHHLNKITNALFIFIDKVYDCECTVLKLVDNTDYV